MKKRIFFFLTSFLFFLSSKSNILASSGFLVDINTEYIVDFKEESIVTYTVNITNLDQVSVVTEQDLNTGLTNIWDVKADSDIKSFDIFLDTSFENGLQVIKSVFNNPIVGKDSTYSYRITFKTDKILQQNGLVKEIYIPSSKNDPNINSFTSSVTVPKSFGELNYASPNPNKINKNADSITYFFSDSQNLNGIAIFFGDFQLFTFDLKYQLENKDSLSNKMNIAIPADIKNRQAVTINRISPEPENVTVDRDGNYLAEYNVERGKKVKVEVAGIIKVKSSIIEAKNSAYIMDAPKSSFDYLTKQDTYWESQNAEIKQLASFLVNTQETVVSNAKKIYDYVTKFLTYNYDRTDNVVALRLGAVEALKNPKNAVCMEYTDLTIALLRSAGIPAREINGFAYSQNIASKPLSVFFDKDVDLLHTWVEFYDPNIGWIQIDPTWGSTSNLDYFSSLDTNHITFVRKGESSLYPIPPGAYRTTDTREKLVDIKFGNLKLLKANASKGVIINVNNVSTKVINKTGATIYNINLKGDNDSENIDLIPPFGSVRTFINNVKIVSYFDFDGKKMSIEPNITQSFISIKSFRGIVLTLVLCMIFCTPITLLYLRSK